MSQPATKTANAFWTDEETVALLNHLLPHQLESEGAGGFNNAVFKSAIPQLLSFYERGGTKEVRHLKSKWKLMHMSRFHAN